MMPAGLAIGPLTFLAPLTLIGLLALPIIWWILRVTPPAPKQMTFPPLQILQDVLTEEETPNSTPLWLLLFRLFMVALLAVALAYPFMTEPENSADRPLALVIDNGWDAAPNWGNVVEDAENRIIEARRNNLPVLIISTQGENQSTEFQPAQDALRLFKSLSPQALPSDRQKAADQLSAADISNAQAVWISSGIDFGKSSALADQLKLAASAVRLAPDSESTVLVPGLTEETSDGFRSVWHRPDTRSLRNSEITAHGRDGGILARGVLTFAPGEAQADAAFDLPTEIRSRITALRAGGSPSAGSVKLLDDSWGRPLVGILTQGADSGSPLLSEPFYTETALAPFADLFTGSLDELLPIAPSVIIMPDEARTEDAALREYVENGGLLIRFAGPKLAKRTDELLPVIIRNGGREFGGALTWEDPQKLAPFGENSPFFGLAIPDEITVRRQIMAEPGSETDSNTWARLEDGSPVVTSSQLGFGRIVFFHVTAGPEWSNLAIGGLYVDMLRRILSMARAGPDTSVTTDGTWAPERVLTGTGRLTAPDIYAQPIEDAEFANVTLSQAHPPGLYRLGARRKALNTVSDPEAISAIGNLDGVSVQPFGETRLQTLSGVLLTIVALMLIIDVLFALIVSGRLAYLKKPKFRSAAALVIAAALLAVPDNAAAQEFDVDPAALELHLAYVKTGDARTDQMSEAAMRGLVGALNRRTTIEPVGVRGVDPETDVLVYYPFLYWPVARDAAPLSPKAVDKLNDFMAGGGTIVFDTQDVAEQSFLGGSPHPGLTRITENLDIPRLTEVPEDHVLTKSFYLIQVFPGRWANGRVWVDRNNNGAARDGVSSVIIGSNDWAAGWAMDENNIPLVGLEREIANQREMSLRFGVNLAMYALAGNYKSDQVHAKALVERLGLQQMEPRNLGPAGDDE